jgi:hypothetical protein
VHSTEDVSTAIKVLTAGFSGNSSGNSTGCLFAIKSGGHNANLGANNIDGGVTLDLTELDDVSLSADAGSVWLGGGQHWRNVYNTLSDITVAGGGCATTGVGGVSLGGGIPLLLPSTGFGTSNIGTFEVVLASGEVVNATEDQNADLWRVLKGGGNNFGVVTHIDLKLPGGNGSVYGGIITYPANGSIPASIIGNITKFTTANNDDDQAWIMVNFAYTAKGSEIEITAVRADGKADSSILEPFYDTTPQLNNTVRERTLSSITEEALGTVDQSVYKTLQVTVTYRNDQDTIEDILRISNDTWNSLSDIPDLTLLVSFNPIPWVAVQKSVSNGGDNLGLDREQADRVGNFASPPLHIHLLTRANNL